MIIVSMILSSTLMFLNWLKNSIVNRESLGATKTCDIAV